MGSTMPTFKVVSGTGTLRQEILEDGVVVMQYTTYGQIVVEVGSALLYIVGAYYFGSTTMILPIIIFG